MKTTIILIAALLTFLTLCPSDGEAASIHDFFYCTNFEETVFEEIIWFWTPDTMYGRVHSNDYIGLKYSPHFYGPVYTSQDHFLEYQASPHFAYEPTFNAPQVEFPRELTYLREHAQPFVPSRNGRLMTWIQFLGENGIDIYQYPAGSQRVDSLYQHLNVPWYQPWEPHGLSIFVDGDCEVAGNIERGGVLGHLTIGCSGDMYLIDDLQYRGTDRYGRWDDNRDPGSMLGLAAEGNILITDNFRNGKENGADVAPNDMQRHSIIINAALVALGESFTFEHQNDDWDNYQGPSPDERGYIYLKGSIAQYRRGYVHRANHNGTGYGKSYQYDFRFDRIRPPGMNDGEQYIVSGRSDSLMLDEEHLIRNLDVDVLELYSGADLILEGQNALVVRERLRIHGTEEQPVIFRPRDHDGRTLVRVERGANSKVDIEWVHFDRQVDLQIDCDSLQVRNCEFGGECHWTGTLEADSSKFYMPVQFISWSDIHASRNLFFDGLRVRGDVENAQVINNTFVEGDAAALSLEGYEHIEVINNIIAFNDLGILNEAHNQPVMRYNDVYGNYHGNYENCRPGRGSISSDPVFRDRPREDYHLAFDSPCRNGGDPNLPRDPDGTRSDIGAYFFDHDNPFGVEPDEQTLPAEFAIRSIYPNPFNAAATISFDLPVQANTQVLIYNLSGTIVDQIDSGRLAAGNHAVTWSAHGMAAGVYLLRMQCGEYSDVRKVVLVR